MSPEDEDDSKRLKGHSSSLEAEIVEILKNKAFVTPLTPMDERKVLDALSGFDIPGETICR